MHNKELEIKQCKKDMDSVITSLGKAKKKVTVKENELVRFRDERTNLCLQCKVDEIELPYTDVEDAEDDRPSSNKRKRSKTSKKSKPKRRRTRNVPSDDESSSSDEESPAEEDFDESESFSLSQQSDVVSLETPESQSQVPQEFIKLDFSKLSKRKKSVRDEKYSVRYFTFLTGSLKYYNR